MTFFAFLDLVDNNFQIIDSFSFYCLFAISIFVIQRFYFGMIYIVYVLAMLFYSFQFVNDEQPISKELILGFIFALSLSGLLALHARNRMLLSIFDFNRYLKKLSQGDKFGFFLFKIENEKVKILDFDQDIGVSLTGKNQNTKDDFSEIFNEKLTKNDIKNLLSLTGDHYITKLVKINDKSFELILSSIKLKKREYFLVKTNNVTERIKEQEELILSEEKYRNLYNENQAGVFTLNLSFHLVNYNKTFEYMFEGTFQIGSLFVDNDDEMRELLDIISEKQKFNNYQTHFTLRNGTIKWLVFNFYFDSQNHLIEGTVVDVSEIQKASTALRKSEEKYKLIYEESNDAILLLDDDKVIDVNRRCMQLFGIPKEDFLKITLWDLSNVQEEEEKIQLKQFKHKLKLSGTVKFNWIFKGKYNPIEAEVAISELVIGKQIIHQCVIHDVTDKNNTIRALEKSTRNFQSVLESTPEGIFILKDDTILYANKEVYQLIGKETIDINNLFIPEDQTVFEELLKQKITHKNIQNQLNLKSENGVILVDVTMVNTIFGATEALLIIMKDISLQMQLSKEVLRAELAEENTKKLEKEIKERIKTEIELQNLLLKTKAIYDSSSNIFLMTLDLKGRITYFNKHSQNYFMDLTGKVLETGVFITTYFNKYYTKEQINEFKQVLDKVMDGKSRQFEFLFGLENNFKWIEVFMNPIYDAEGRISEISLMSHDITIKKEAEKETIESLHEKEVLLKEIHHRVKNNLQVISSILNLQSSFVSDKKTLGILQESRNRIRSMAIIHENLYRTTNFSSIDFAGYLKNLVMNLSALYHQDQYNVDIIYDLQQVDISLDQAVPSGLIMNELITNSLKYAFVNGEKKKNQLLISMKEENGVIYLRVKDNGIGLPENFEIGKTDTLGLQLVVTLTEQLDASLNYKTDNGTDFLISFEKL